MMVAIGAEGSITTMRRMRGTRDSNNRKGSVSGSMLERISLNERRERSDWSETWWCVYGPRMRRLLKLVLVLDLDLDLGVGLALALGASSGFRRHHVVMSVSE
jgi:hypothetical protein